MTETTYTYEISGHRQAGNPIHPGKWSVRRSDGLVVYYGGDFGRAVEIYERRTGSKLAAADRRRVWEDGATFGR